MALSYVDDNDGFVYIGVFDSNGDMKHSPY